MIKRTLYFGNPVYIRTSNQQLVMEFPKMGETKTMPIEDIGLLILDHQQITITQALIARLLENNVAFITCNHTHHPTGLLLNLEGNSLQSQRFRHQIAATQPLKKQLWKQTVKAKIANQALLLEREHIDARPLHALSKRVKSDDKENCEATAAVYYWDNIFPEFLSFRREREGLPPNNLLNYGYAILRALVARNLVGSGLLPTLGIHHRNQYNAYCLADDIMEPYRPYVDKVVCDIVRMNGRFLEMGEGFKKQLLSIPMMDVFIQGKKSPLMNAVQRTTASLAQCFEGERTTIAFPKFRYK